MWPKPQDSNDPAKPVPPLTAIQYDSRMVCSRRRHHYSALFDEASRGTRGFKHTIWVIVMNAGARGMLQVSREYLVLEVENNATRRR